jgi:hypothetical protein
MCLSVPARVVEVLDLADQLVRVDIAGAARVANWRCSERRRRSGTGSSCTPASPSTGWSREEAERALGLLAGGAT